MRKIRLAYKFRLYPTQEQEQKLRQHAGNTRFLWNYFLDLNTKHYQETQKFVFGHDLIMSIPSLKQSHNFLGLSFSQSLQQVGKHFDRALKDFLDPKLTRGFPTRKLKAKERDSFTVPQKFRIGKTFVFLPKIGEVKWVKHRPIKGKVKHLTVKRDGDQWYCSVCVELNVKDQTIKTENLVGVDVGLKTFATMSDGEIIENPKHLKQHEKKLNRLQRRLGKREKGSANRHKQRRKISRLHRRVRNIRRDFQHKMTKYTIAKCDGVVLETLNIKGMMSNHCLSKAIADCGWYEFKRQLRYKADWYGKVFVEIDRFEPTSKSCSDCGWIDQDLCLNDRVFKCESCGATKDRDMNAAINIRDCGRQILWEAQEFTLGETRGCRASAQCLSLSQEKESFSPTLIS